MRRMAHSGNTRCTPGTVIWLTPCFGRVHIVSPDLFQHVSSELFRYVLCPPSRVHCTLCRCALQDFNPSSGLDRRLSANRRRHCGQQHPVQVRVHCLVTQCDFLGQFPRSPSLAYASAGRPAGVHHGLPRMITL